MADTNDSDSCPGALAHAAFHAPAPVGMLTVWCSATAVVRVDFGDTAGDDSPHPPEVLRTALRELDEYFGGTRRTFTVPVAGEPADPASFRTRAQAALSEIPYGAVWTYGELAAASGSPQAARAAGTACATNPVPVIVPCHRVVPAGNPEQAVRRVGNYGGGADMKRGLIAHERSHTPSNGTDKTHPQSN